jgi:tripartite-type tricarboxylate transporter receptor subunit TctC
MRKGISAALLLALAIVSHAFAQSSGCPNKPIRWVVPFAPAGGTDLVARPVAQRLSEKLEQTILYDNRGGAGGVIAGDIVAKAAPDGYTLLVAAVAVMTVNVSLVPKMPFDPVKDFAPITKFAGVPNMVAARVTAGSHASGTCRIRQDESSQSHVGDVRHWFARASWS